MRPLIIVIACALAPSLAGAQFPDRVQAGARVRVWIPEAHNQDNGPWRRQLLRGTVNSVQGDALLLTVPGTDGTLTVPRSAIRRIDVSRGQSRVASAFERAVAGAIVGAIAAAFENDPKSTEWPHYNRTWRAAEEGAKGGALLGAVVGFVLPTERWKRLRLR